MTGQEWLQYFMDAEDKKKRKNDWMDLAGTGLGAGVGFLVAGPAGAIPGAQIGGAAGGLGEAASNKELTPESVVGNVMQGVGGYGGVSDAMDQKGLMELLRQIGGTPMGFESGGIVPDPRVLMELLSGGGPLMADEPRPTPQPMAQSSHPGWEAAAAILGDVLSKLPPPRQTNSSNKTIGAYTPALGAGLSGIAERASKGREAENKRRQESNIAAEESWRTGAREMSRRRWDLMRDRMNQRPAAESVLDKPFTKEEAKRLKRPELEGVTRRDAGFFNDENARGVGVTPAKKFDYLNTLRDNMRVDPDVKDFGTVRDNYRRVERMTKMGQGVGDLAIIFSYMKVLDPTSVVRETEFKNAADAVGKLQQFINLPSGIVRGTRLTPEGRQWFVNASWELFKAKQGDYANALRSYRDEAATQGVDASSVLKRYERYLDDEFMGGVPNGNPDMSKYVGGK